VGRDDLLVQVYTAGIGHGGPVGGFIVDQQVRAIEAIDAWARSGTRPAPATFPAELGFIPGFVPPAWTAEIASPSIRQLPLDGGWQNLTGMASDLEDPMKHCFSNRAESRCTGVAFAGTRCGWRSSSPVPPCGR
jgi:hypothetical protein